MCWFRGTSFLFKKFRRLFKVCGEMHLCSWKRNGLSVLFALPTDSLKRFLLCSWGFPLITTGVGPITMESPQHPRQLINHRGKNV